MFIAIFGIIDLLVGVVLLFSGHFVHQPWLGTLTLIFFLKALYSILTALAAGFLFDLMGYLDFVGAIILLLLFWGIAAPWFFWIGVLILLKGIYSLLVAFMLH